MIDVHSIKTPESYEAVFGPIVPKKPKSPITIICEMCGDETKLSREGKRYCSARCRAAAHDCFKDPRLSRLNTVAETAAFLGCSPTTVRQRIRRGDLQAHRVGNMLLVVRPLGVRTVADVMLPLVVTERFVRFAEGLDLSVREFAKAFGLSRTTAHRLLSGRLLASQFPKRKMLMVKALIDFLISRGGTSRAAKSVAEALFKD